MTTKRDIVFMRYLGVKQATGTSITLVR